MGLVLHLFYQVQHPRLRGRWSAATRWCLARLSLFSRHGPKTLSYSAEYTAYMIADRPPRPCRLRSHGETPYMRALLFLILTTVTLGAQAKTALLQHVPLKWSPTSDLRLGTMEMSQAPIQ